MAPYPVRVRTRLLRRLLDATSPRRRSHDTLTFAQTQEYKRDGSVARGPAPKPLKLAKVDVDEKGQVVLEKWTDQDFRENV